MNAFLGWMSWKERASGSENSHELSELEVIRVRLLGKRRAHRSAARHEKDIPEQERPVFGKSASTRYATGLLQRWKAKSASSSASRMMQG